MIGIITDSTCDIPENLLEQYGIIVIPQTVIWGDEQYKDRVGLQPHEFYRRLETDPVRPHSSMPNVPDFLEVYKEAAIQGATEIIMLTVSSAMSGTYEIAQKAANLFHLPVSVVDSKGPTMSLGWQVLAAARARDSGANLTDILKQVERVRQNVVQLVGMDTLEYLQSGGRIGGAIKWVGTLLKVKPLVSINHQTGLVEPVSLSRTHKTLVDQLYTKFFNQLNGTKNLHIAVLHGNAVDAATALAERIRAEYNPTELLINITGPVLGINTGPGALALCGYAED